MHEGRCQNLVIASDDAGQFNILLHALCWVHSERLIHTLIPLNEGHREDIAKVRGELRDLYADLKYYKDQPIPAQKETQETRFDAIFTQKTRYELLNQALKRIHKNKSELLLVLERPEIPLHTNGSERDIRDYVKKKKVSGGTRSTTGRRCRDTFASLKKTCRKQGISFWHYLLDRLSGTGAIPPLPELIRCSTATR
ncbi:MAG: transposase [Proteobacteria bacterium]|nr:transposase [Pseudomonadota bacterium]